MMKLHLFTILTLLTLLPLTAQEENTPTNSRFWEASLPGGEYIVSLSRITSVSMHTYMIEGGFKVTEVIIDTSGNSLARFYHVIPAGEDGVAGAGAGLVSRGKELLDQAGEKVGIEASSIVMKQYPTTTHAKTVEYAISNDKSLQSLFKSAKSAWIRNRGNKFTIKNQ